MGILGIVAKQSVHYVFRLDEGLRVWLARLTNLFCDSALDVRIAALNGGLHEERIFTKFPEIDLIYNRETKLEYVMFQYDIFIIPFHIDQIYLSSIRGLLNEFVVNGGILIIIGATQESGREWIPYCQWRERYTESLKPLEIDTEDKELIFSGIPSVEELKYHGKYYSHGAFNRRPTGTISLVTDTHDFPIMLIKKEGIKGVFFATTLDSDFHAVMQVPGGTQEETDRTRDNAFKLLENIIKWAKLESKKRKMMDKIRWRIRGWLKIGWYYIKIVFSIFIPTILTIYLGFLYYGDQSKLWNLVFLVIGCVGSFASIISFYQQNSIKKRR